MAFVTILEERTDGSNSLELCKAALDILTVQIRSRRTAYIYFAGHVNETLSRLY